MVPITRLTLAQFFCRKYCYLQITRPVTGMRNNQGSAYTVCILVSPASDWMWAKTNLRCFVIYVYELTYDLVVFQLPTMQLNDMAVNITNM